MKYFLLITCMLIICGCEETERTKRLRERNDAAWKACIDAGGVPIQSWFSEEVLGDCKFK